MTYAERYDILCFYPKAFEPKKSHRRSYAGSSYVTKT